MDREWWGGSIEIMINKKLFSTLQDILVLPEYHLSEPKPGLFYGDDSTWYKSLEIFDKSQTIKIEGVDIDKIYKRFLE